ncbi:hypothetical protein K458DRAFT_299694 [Lentithecium fluviatile CBS 122367]|uniref:Uncharacterized protein n=1 Tax=Lentithecium fluviatile CBS 122367 TaxID=1168545 RepID=A0A6G1J5R2_9PLEO|nr:hypothetical protein K458DRAFT_299694 [Lentithecium fluviatile CBS 122367]
MPADRRSTFAATKPVKTERTHEENQERAYIAASRRSDRSLEARIESARRASEIHKKRTGRALRVTEQDVVNEEMYEEEDDDLPTQYQRLNAHLQTSSWLFNRKLQDYIATQHGVRNMFLHQQFPGMQPYGAPMQPDNQMPLMNQSMFPPQPFNPATQGFQPPQTYASQAYQQQQQQQGYRHAPYNIPQRPQPHQRSASIAQANTNATNLAADASRRMSLPPHAFEQASQHGNEAQSRPPLSRTSTLQSVKQQPVSPQHVSAPGSGPDTPLLKSEHSSPTSYQFPTLPFSTTSQVLNMNPLTLSLPPESQQLIGSALDPNDPHTAVFMEGSENLPQPFMGTYTYNPNISPKSAQARNVGFSASGMTQTLAPEDSNKMDRAAGNATSNTPPSAMMDNTYTPHQLFTPTGFDYKSYFDQYQGADATRAANDGMFNETYEENSFVNWDQ